METHLLAEAGDILKELYASRITEMSKLKDDFLASLPKSDDGLSLDKLEVRPFIRQTLGSSVGARWEGEAFASGTGPDGVTGLVRTTKQTGAFEWTPEREKRQTVDGKAAWTNIFDDLESDQIAQLAEAYARQAFGEGNGVIARCGVTSNATTVVLAAATKPAQLRCLRVGMKIDIGTVASPASVAAGRLITAINNTNKTITISGAAVTTDADTRIFVQGAGGATSWGNRELVSLQQIAGSGNLYGIDVSENPGYVGYQNGNGGTNRSLTEVLADRVRTDIRQNRGVEPTDLVTAPAVFAQGAGQFSDKVQYTMAEYGDLKVRRDSLELGGLTIHRSDFCWENTGFVYNTGPDGISFITSGVEFVTEGGGVVRVREGGDVRYANWAEYAQLVATNRRSVGIITDLTGAW